MTQHYIFEVVLTGIRMANGTKRNNDESKLATFVCEIVCIGIVCPFSDKMQYPMYDVDCSWFTFLNEQIRVSVPSFLLLALDNITEQNKRTPRFAHILRSCYTLHVPLTLVERVALLDGSDGKPWYVCC